MYVNLQSAHVKLMYCFPAVYMASSAFINRVSAKRRDALVLRDHSSLSVETTPAAGLFV